MHCHGTIKRLVAAAMEGAARPIGTKIGHFQMPKDTCGRLEMEFDLLTLKLSDNLLQSFIPLSDP